MIPSFKSNKTLISLANCFAGGIFLSAGLIHIIPEAIEQWGKGSGHSHDHDHDHVHSNSFLENISLSTGLKHSTGGLGHGPGESEPFPWVTFSILASFSVILLIDRVLLPGHHGHADEEVDTFGDKATPSDKLSDKLTDHHDHGEHGHDHHHHEHKAAEGGHDHANALGPYMLILAMGVHAIFEGLALGLLSDFAGFLGFLLAIVFHKWAECMAVGISFLKNNVPIVNTLIALAAFSALTPLGIVAGIFFSDTGSKFKAILLGISGGTFLYIAIAEILSEEFNTKKNIVARYVAYVTGTSVMIIVWFAEQLGSAK